MTREFCQTCQQFYWREHALSHRCPPLPSRPLVRRVPIDEVIDSPVHLQADGIKGIW